MGAIEGWAFTERATTADDVKRMQEAVCGAIGWIAATTNEGNNQTSKWTREQLVLVNRFLTANCPPQAQFKSGSAQ